MSYDIVIRNGTIVDGAGGPQYRADVAVSDGKIAEVGKVTDGAKKIIDASDLLSHRASLIPTRTMMPKFVGTH